MLEVRNVLAGYGRADVVRDVSVDVGSGETVALLGPNGAGKSTFMAALTGTLRKRAGSVRLDGEELMGMDSHRIVARGMALSPEGRLIFPRLRERERQTAGTLSGGEQQMLAVGRALMSAPRMLLLDEPFLGLAPMIVREIHDALEVLKRDGLSLLLVEQKLDVALAIAERAYVLIKGRVEFAATADELRRREDLDTLYFSLARLQAD